MPLWMLPIEFFGKIALKFGLKYLEDKYPGIKPIINIILKWVEGQTAFENSAAIPVLNEHVAKFCTGVGCPTPVQPLN